MEKKTLNSKQEDLDLINYCELCKADSNTYAPSFTTLKNGLVVCYNCFNNGKRPSSK